MAASVPSGGALKSAGRPELQHRCHVPLTQCWRRTQCQRWAHVVACTSGWHHRGGLAALQSSAQVAPRQCSTLERLGRGGASKASSAPGSVRTSAAGGTQPQWEQPAAREKLVWVQTSSKSAFTAGCEAGLRTFVFPPDSGDLAESWKALARFEALDQSLEGLISCDGNRQVGRLVRVTCRADVEAAAALAGSPGVVVMDAEDWQSIPAENLVAAFTGSPATLLATATSLDDARVKLQALETGTAGVLLRTEDPAVVRAVAEYVKQAAADTAVRLAYDSAIVSSVRSIGMGDRVCVDLCSLLAPGEGLLAGSFASGLFLLHSECTESKYINSRPFRINAGPVHAYVHAPGGRTAYLSELASGSDVVIADAGGSQRSAVVGRVKIETRPLVLIEAETSDGRRHSVILQNAETVRLVGPTDKDADPSLVVSEPVGQLGGMPGWQAISVSQLTAGDRVYVLCQSGARHTGLKVQEACTER